MPCGRYHSQPPRSHSPLAIASSDRSLSAMQTPSVPPRPGLGDPVLEDGIGLVRVAGHQVRRPQQQE